MGSQGEQKQKNKQGEQKPGDPSGEARDTRMKKDGQDGEKNRQAGKQNQPKSGDTSNDPAKRLTKGNKSDDEKAKAKARDAEIAGWRAALPPEIRDAIDAGRSEDIPDRYKSIVRRYNLWLQKNRRENGR